MELVEYLGGLNRIALAYSGGVDSAYLLYAAVTAGIDVTAYYVKTEFQPSFEYHDALRLASDLEARLKVIETSVICDDTIVGNPPDRCYYCKQLIMGAIIKQARADGYDTLIDGTNASDDTSDRPGYRALQELSVLSPLRICGLTKDRIRELSKSAGLFTWDKPAYACLATRVRCGEQITGDILARIERAEDYLMGLGFSDFRVRVSEDTARLEISAKQINMFESNADTILDRIKGIIGNVEKDIVLR